MGIAPASAIGQGVEPPLSSTARAKVISYKGWDVEVVADIVRGSLGASEAVCVLASRTTYRERETVEKVEVRLGGCALRKLDTMRSEARLYRVDPTAWEGIASSGRMEGVVWRDVFRWDERRAFWDLVSQRRTPSRLSVDIRWARVPDNPWAVAFTAAGVSPSASPPLCFIFAPPFIGPCLRAKAGATRPALTYGTIRSERLGTIDIRGLTGQMSLHVDPIGYWHG